MGPMIRIGISVALLLAVLSAILLISIYPAGKSIFAVILKYIWVFIGSFVLVTLVIDRIFDGIFKRTKDELNDY